MYAECEKLTKGCDFSFRVWTILRFVRDFGTALCIKWNSWLEPRTWKIFVTFKCNSFCINACICRPSRIVEKQELQLLLQSKIMFNCYMSLVMRKPVFGVCDHIKTSKQTGLLSYRDQLEFLDCADAQADLRLCCSHIVLTGFVMTWLIL